MRGLQYEAEFVNFGHGCGTGCKMTETPVGGPGCVECGTRDGVHLANCPNAKTILRRELITETIMAVVAVHERRSDRLLVYYTLADVKLKLVPPGLDAATQLRLEQRILDVWYDLFRQRVLTPGHDFDRPDFPWFHRTAEKVELGL